MPLPRHLLFALFLSLISSQRAGAAELQTLQPLLSKYCYECHGDGAASGEFAMDTFRSAEAFVGGTKQWEKAIAYARAQVMPPPDAEHQPSQDERDQIVRSVQRIVYKIDPAKPDPGRVTIRRLNSAEYRNTIRDLIGVQFDPTLDFPPDDTGYGFDNIGDVLSLPPMLLEKYIAAADKILDEGIVTDVAESRQRRMAATQALVQKSEDKSVRSASDWVQLTSAKEEAIAVPIQVKAPAEYVVRVLAYAKRDSSTQPSTRPSTQPTRATQLSLTINNMVIKQVDVTASASKPQWIEAKVAAPVGAHTLGASVRRLRGVKEDKTISGGRIGIEQPGAVMVKEIVIEGPVRGAVRRLSGDRLRTDAERQNEAVNLFAPDQSVTGSFDVAIPAEYILRAQCTAQFAGDEDAVMELVLDGKPLKQFAVKAPAAHQKQLGEDLVQGADRPVPQIYEVTSKLDSGTHQLSVRFLNDVYLPKEKDTNFQDRNLIVQYLEVVDTSAPACPPMPPKMRALFVKHAGEHGAISNAPMEHNPRIARALLSDFVLHAWRRPPRNDEMDRVMKLYATAKDNGASFHGSIKHAMLGVLVSSNFLFRGEIESSGKSAGVEQIGEYELASRLSYFLWSTMPDDELLDLAAKGKLRTNLDQQIKRMRNSPKFKQFTENFAGQWLQFRNLDAAHPDPKMFATYNDRIRDAMQRETQMFFESIARDDQSMMDLLTGDYTFVNEQLATLYGIKGVTGKEFRRVSLKGTNRRGVLTQGSVLTLTSNPTRTSPVKRGKWVMENLLGTAPPPPPPDIPALVDPGKPLTGTVRQQLEKHRENATCASCHAAMDPIGFALENFDAIGAWREKDGKDEIDASSSFTDGKTFTGPLELTDTLITTRKNDFLRSIAEHTLTFALGRGVEPTDQPAVDAIVGDLKKDDAKFSTLINSVVNSVPFQMRRVGTTAQARAGNSE